MTVVILSGISDSGRQSGFGGSQPVAEETPLTLIAPRKAHDAESPATLNETGQHEHTLDSAVRLAL